VTGIRLQVHHIYSARSRCAAIASRALSVSNCLSSLPRLAPRAWRTGIRLALGADQRVILRQVLWHSALMVGPGIAIGLAASVAGARLMTRFLYQVEPTDAVTYAGVSLTLAAAALAASAWPAWRAARVDPLVALRDE